MNLRKIFTKRYVIFLILEILLIGIASYTAIIKIHSRRASAATSWQSCMNINSNARIACIGRSAELTGIRYGKSSSTEWLAYWRSNGYPNLSSITGSFGTSCKGPYNTCSWWTRDRFNDNTNFLGCNGFVNVALYLALGNKTFAGSYSGGYQYLTYTKNGATNKVFKKIQYPRYEDLQPGDLLVIPGHVAIMSRKDPTPTYPRRIQIVHAMGNKNIPSSEDPNANSKSHEYPLRDFNAIKDEVYVLRLQDGLITRQIIPD